MRHVPALAVVLGLSCPMFMLYGSMLDTFQISLPFMVGFLVLRARSDVECRPTNAVAGFGVATLLVISSWQGALLCATFVRARRMPPRCAGSGGCG